MNKDNLRRFHRVLLGKIDLQLVGFACIKRACSASKLNRPPLKIVCDLVLESRRGVDLPLDELLLQPIAGDFAQGGCDDLARGSGGGGHASMLK